MESAEQNLTKKLDGSCPVDLGERTAFLMALRESCPHFWRGFNEVFRSGVDACQREPGVAVDLAAAVNCWLRNNHIVDRWLVETLHATWCFWESDPEGPNATLREGYTWFMVDITDTSVPDFTPIFKDPFPRWSGPDSRQALRSILNASPTERPSVVAEALIYGESLKSFESRMNYQFRAQLTHYIKQVRRRYGYRQNAETPKHARWTALVFCGIPYARIARKDRSLKKYRDPESAVRNAVHRLAKRIELTLPPTSYHGAPLT